ncbi:MAG: 4-alpha-glucanotransferase [Deltaproteobacteria bacterium]|jgi:4-alpha-glucanotransferase|nr:4-alpha-glucanotransferase [Deltaproteobacteria bacterium]
MPKDNRSCGVLLHISSLPSKYGIGSLGPEAHAFAETLAAAGIKYWQFLPLTPTSTFIGNSPYSSPSAFAGNPLFISLEVLQQEKLLSEAEIINSGPRLPDDHPCKRPDRVDYNAVSAQHDYLLELVFQRQEASLENDRSFKTFVAENNDWLLDYALFTAIKITQGGTSWLDWPKGLKWHRQEALKLWLEKNKRAVLKQQFIQYLFFTQWQALRRRCKRLGLQLIGDLPIYVTHDSADVWARPDLFKLDDQGAPKVVAGVPPDYFSATGQRWGNPVYDWAIMQKEDFAWWIKRLAHNLTQADVIRLDHFRGFCAYWEIPAAEKTALQGKWIPAPARAFMLTLKKHFGELPFIAEDLGVITPDVRELMQEFGLPGMKILQFAFGDEAGESPYLPFRHPVNSVVYTGTHDNCTSKQWFMEAGEKEKDNFICYRGQALDPDYANEVLMRLALESQARLAVLPMQDILRLDGGGRMNTPSSSQGNWEWRVSNQEGWLAKEFWSDQISSSKKPISAETDTPVRAPVPNVFGHIHFLCSLYGRLE